MNPVRSRRQWLKILFVMAGVILGIVSVVGAQSPGYRVAVLTPGLTFDPVFRGLQEGLAGLGYKEGTNITFIVEDTKGPVSDLVNRATRLVESKPNVLFTVATAHTAAAQKATATVSIVFAWVGDPVRSGFIASFASSKNNLTGVSNYSGPLSGKRLEVLKEIAPRIKTVLAVVANKESIAENSFVFLDETAKKLGVRALRRDVATKEDIEKAMRETPTGSVDAIYHVPSGLVGAYIDLLIKKAREDRIPLVVHEDTIVEKGAMLSYGAGFKLVGIQAARIVTKVLRGTQPADIPTEIAERQVLAINLTTARAIGLKIPRTILERVDRLVE